MMDEGTVPITVSDEFYRFIFFGWDPSRVDRFRRNDNRYDKFNRFSDINTYYNQVDSSLNRFERRDYDNYRFQASELRRRVDRFKRDEFPGDKK